MICYWNIFYDRTFSDKPCDSVHTQKNRQLFYQPEKGFWMVMVRLSTIFYMKSFYKQSMSLYIVIVDQRDMFSQIHWIYSVPVSVSCSKVLFHLESDNLFHITIVVVDLLDWNPYHCSSCCTVSYWRILEFKIPYQVSFCLNLLSALLE